MVKEMESSSKLEHSFYKFLRSFSSGIGSDIFVTSTRDSHSFHHVNAGA